MKRKIWAVFMTLCMLLGLLPVQTFAKADQDAYVVSIEGKAEVGEKLTADLSKLADDSKAVIQWQEKECGEKDSKAADVKEADIDDEEQSLTLKEKDEGKVFRIMVKEDKDSKKTYVSKWTKEVTTKKDDAKKEPPEQETGDQQSESSHPEAKETENKEKDGQEPEEKTSDAKETKEQESESRNADGKRQEAEDKKPDAREKESKNPDDTKSSETEHKKPDSRDSEEKTEDKRLQPKDQEPETNAPKTLLADKVSIEFAAVKEGYGSAPEAQTVTLTNQSGHVRKLTQPTAQKFEIGSLSDTELAAGETAAFTIQPMKALVKGTYEETIEVTDDGGEKVEIKVKFIVEEAEAPVYTITANAQSIRFETVPIGYQTPDPQSIEVTNTGTASVTLIQPTAVNFEIGTWSASELAPGAKASFTICPKAGLKAGIYEDTIEIKTEQKTGAAVKAVFGVEGCMFRNIVKPASITKENGQNKNAAALGLPGTVKIKTSDGTKRAKVTWNVKAANYSKYETELQKFKVTGKIALPKGVYNPDKVSLQTSVSVTVKAAQRKIPNASENKINHLEEGKTYSANTPLTFYAVGGGMDNKTPKKGDVRYYPASWGIAGINDFATEEFKGTFQLETAGDYTLKVTYNRQEYDGAAWVNDGTADTKMVSFKITSSAAPLNPGKTAAKTGDDSPILPLAVVCIICLICIGGVAASKKKK